MRALTLCALLALTLGAGDRAEAADPMDIGGVRVEIGAAKKEMMESLGESYDLAELRTDLFQVLTRDERKHIVGLVQFREERLVWASRDGGTFEGPEVRKFGQALFNALAAMHEEDEMPIRISTAVNQNQVFSVGSITLDFPGRRLVVYISYDDEIADASIEEFLIPEEPESSEESGSGAEAALPLPPSRRGDATTAPDPTSLSSSGR